MKYLLAIYGNQELWESFSAEELTAAINATEAYIAKYRQTGEMLGAYGLADAARAKQVRVKGGESVVSDGPYLETKEYLASFYLVDCDSEERALQIAAEMPWATEGAVEVWPVLHEPPTQP